MNKKIFLWEMVGIVFIIMLGSLFHFVFEWSGHWEPIAGFFAVNESVWEHLKLPFWPIVIFALIEYNFIKENSNNFLIGKTVAALISIATILLVFYTYTTLFRIELLIVDILSFILGVLIGQVVSYKIMIRTEFASWYTKISWIIMIGLGVIFVIFTYFPPHLPIFQDSNTGLYGIVIHTT